jgi:hypothetical protein
VGGADVTAPLRFLVPDGAFVTWYPSDQSFTGGLNRMHLGLPNGWVVSLLNHPFAMGSAWEVAALWDDDPRQVWDDLDEADVQARIGTVATWGRP